MKIEVFITNLTPIFSAAPGSARVDIDGKEILRGGFPAVLARKQAVLTVNEADIRKVEQVPVVPANSMRSLLRRTMLKHVIEPNLKDRVQLSIGAYAAAYAGNATGNPDGVSGSFDEIHMLRSHPFIGLFGGGPRMLQGRLMVDNLWPMHKHAERIIGDGHESRLINEPITDLVWTRRVDPISGLKEKESADLIKGGAQAANEWIVEAFNSRIAAEEKSSKTNKAEAGQKEEDKDPRGLRAFNAHEVVIAGMEWIWRMNIDNPNKAQVGLMLAALSNMEKERIAGGNSKNYGEFRIDSITVDGDNVWKAGSLDTEKCSTYMDAMAESLDSMTGAEFERFAATAKEIAAKEKEEKEKAKEEKAAGKGK